MVPTKPTLADLSANERKAIDACYHIQLPIKTRWVSNSNANGFMVEGNHVVRLRVSYERRNVSEIPMAFKNLRYLKELVFSNCSVESIPDIFDSFPKLRILDLQWNHHKTLPSSLWKLTSLTHLNLEGNRLKSVPRSIVKLSNLNFLGLRANPMKKFPHSLSRLVNLRELTLPLDIVTLPPSFGDLKNLEKLNNEPLKLSEVPPVKRHKIAEDMLRKMREEFEDNHRNDLAEKRLDFFRDKTPWY